MRFDLDMEQAIRPLQQAVMDAAMEQTSTLTVSVFGSNRFSMARAEYMLANVPAAQKSFRFRHFEIYTNAWMCVYGKLF